MNPDVELRRAFPRGAMISDWRAPDGWICRRMDWPQPAGTVARGSLIFAAGRGDFIEKYLEAHHHWHRRGWNVTTFDWRGQGASRGTIVGGNHASFDPLVEDMAALIADWAGAFAGPCVAVGHSMGGHLLLRTLVDRKPKLDAAVLIAPMIRVNSAPLSPAVAPFMAQLMCLIGGRDKPVWKSPPKGRSAAERRRYFLTGSAERYEDELWWWEREPGYNLGVPSWGWMAAAYRSAAGAFTPSKLRQVDLPVLIVGTERDRLVSPEAIRHAAGFLPRAQLHMYAHAAHEILREADPIRLDAHGRIDAFLDEQAR
jgi:lysophospholipase